MDAIKELKLEIREMLIKETGEDCFINTIVKPPNSEMGDLSVQLFSIAKKLGKNPNQLAEELVSKIELPNTFYNIKAFGPYINFFVQPQKLAEKVLSPIRIKGVEFFNSEIGKGKKINVEYFSPNTNKPMTLGHLRNLSLGSTYVRLLQKSGYDVTRSILFNDRGIAIAKSMVAYDLFGKERTPESENIKSDKFVGDFYVLFGKEVEKDESLNEKASEYLRRFEDGDKKIISKWKQMNKWVYAGYAETLNNLNEDLFEQRYYESEIYSQGREVIQSNINNGVIKKGEGGEVFAFLEKANLPNKILLRSDGTSLYITQDIRLAYIKNEAIVDELVYVIGDEQNLQMKQLFEILKSLPNLPNNFFHFSYGMMRLPDGKIKSREGFGRALADALIDKLIKLADIEVKERNPEMSDKERKKVAKQIMNGALKYYILSVDPNKAMVFNPETAVNFNGNTGPYIQYTVVRLRSILAKVGNVPTAVDYSLLSDEREHNLIFKLASYNEVIKDATTNHMPSLLTHYIFELAKETNSYYADVSILKANDNIRDTRLALVQALVLVIEDALSMCGIEVPEKM